MPFATARHPLPQDILCVIEVADSSLDYDRTTKQRIYAAAGIPQYTLINLVDRGIEVRRAPDSAHGAYTSTEQVSSNGAVVFQLGDGAVLAVPATDLLP